MSDQAMAQEWAVRKERGVMPLIKVGVWLAQRLGRHIASLLLYPICVYFVISSPRTNRCSLNYLSRVLKRPPTLAGVFRHYRTFASCVLDRVFFLSDKVGQFEIHCHDEETVAELMERGEGCFLFGSHFGSFEVIRAAGRWHGDVSVTLIMYEENARKIRKVLAAINPDLETEVVAIGHADSLITVADRLSRGHFVGLLADRSVNGEDCIPLPFLGDPAPFPRGPFRMAALLRRPVVMMAGVYRGGRTYDVYFKTLIEVSEFPSQVTESWIEAVMHRYVAWLEHHCRSAPFNWFNFYNFWA